MKQIVSVNRARRLALTDTGDACEITNFYDADGDDTDDPGEALTAVARLDDDNWFTIDLTAFEEAEVH